MKAAQNIDDEIDGLNILCPDSAGSAESSKFQGNSQQNVKKELTEDNHLAGSSRHDGLSPSYSNSVQDIKVEPSQEM